MIRQCAVLFGCLALGELIVSLTHIPIPASIIGMLILTLLLRLQIIKLEWVKDLSDFLIKNIGLFFVPPGVALMLHFELIEREITPIIIATFLSTIIVLAITGWVHQYFSKDKSL